MRWGMMWDSKHTTRGMPANNFSQKLVLLAGIHEVPVRIPTGTFCEITVAFRDIPHHLWTSALHFVTNDFLHNLQIAMA